MKILTYSFRTFPYKHEIGDILGDVVILDKLKVDIDNLCNKISLERPDAILGLAMSKKNYSTIEAYTINKFNNNKVINNDILTFEMDLPDNLIFNLRKIPTSSFCNYSMFKVKSFLHHNDLQIPFVFVHLVESDIVHLGELFK